MPAGYKRLCAQLQRSFVFVLRISMAMSSDLGQWALIDIETSGVDPSFDKIIDVGFLQFEGTTLVRTYESLVRYDGELPQIIQKLTGIESEMLWRAPVWRTVEPEVMELYGHHLVAHNADFEKSFLGDDFAKLRDHGEAEKWEDSLYYLTLLFPQRSSYKLENFIIDWKLAVKEEHRGLADSRDLLKVMLLATVHARKDSERFQALVSGARRYNFDDQWFFKFLNLDGPALDEIARAIDFDLDQAYQNAFAPEVEVTSNEFTPRYSFSFDSERIKEIFREEARVREIFPEYIYRAAQEELSLRVGQSFKNDVHALVQAPTGTGKTMGYLVPAALFSLAEKKQVLISTGTKTLQHQCMSKDVPQLRRMLGLNDERLKIKRLIGSNNHLCELMFRQENNEGELLREHDFASRFSEFFFEMVFYHNTKAQGEEKILRADLPYLFKIKFQKFATRERELAVDFRACAGNKCPFKSECSYLGGLKEAREADIIVGNHALMFAWPRAFPRPSYIVVDEAHKIEEETTRAFSHEVDEEAMNGLMKNLQHAQGIGSLYYLLAQFESEPGASTAKINSLRETTQQTLLMLQDHVLGLRDLVERYFKKNMQRYTDQFWNELPMVSNKTTQEVLGISIFNHLDSIKNILAHYNDTLLPYALMWEGKDMKNDQQAQAFTRFEAFASQVQDILAGLDTVVNLKEGYAHAMRFHERHGYVFSAAPIDVGRATHDHLLQTSSAVVFTSATLGNATGDMGAKGMEWATGYAYLEPERRFKHGFFLPAPYDYENRTRIFLCDDVPKLYEPGFVPDVLRDIVPLIRDLGGRSLLLFSAKARFEIACELLLRAFAGEIPVFIQGMGNNVVDEFKQSRAGILVGMESFGEGIDIPGEALQFVFIDKIPDLRKELVIDKRQDFYESGLGNAFTDYYLAHRTRSLHQKLGRLLRTEDDFGGVIVVDSRVKGWKGRTMQTLLRLMEPYKIRRAPLKEACLSIKDFIGKPSLDRDL
jgi:ATP-dependent DNA helicase DinG